MHPLTHKVAIVTGASSGIGRAASILFASRGARVLVAARRRPELETLVAEIQARGGSALAVPGDVADPAFARLLVNTALERFGRLDVAFNNAGALGPLQPTPAVDLSAWEATLRVNLTSAFLAAQAQIPAMLDHGGGSVIFTSTFVGHTVGMAQMAAYAASKAGLIGLTQSLAVEYGSHNIRVNALLPGGTDTPMGRVVADSPEALAFVRGLHALRRIADPEEIAQAALFLASDASSFVTGTAMLVDGGVSVQRA